MVSSGQHGLTEVARTLSERYKIILKKQTVDRWKKSLETSSTKDKSVNKTVLTAVDVTLEDSDNLVSMALSLIKKNWNQAMLNSIIWLLSYVFCWVKRMKLRSQQQIYTFITIYLKSIRNKAILKQAWQPPLRNQLRLRTHHPQPQFAILKKQN